MDTEGPKASAVTYLGICSNLEEISQLCYSHNIPFGAQLVFHEDLPLSTLDQGDDLSIQSTHKVLS